MAKPEEIAKFSSEKLKTQWINKVETIVLDSDKKLKNRINLDEIQNNFYTGKTPEQVAINYLKNKK